MSLHFAIFHSLGCSKAVLSTSCLGCFLVPNVAAIQIAIRSHFFGELVVQSQSQEASDSFSAGSVATLAGFWGTDRTRAGISYLVFHKARDHRRIANGRFHAPASFGFSRPIGPPTRPPMTAVSHVQNPKPTQIESFWDGRKPQVDSMANWRVGEPPTNKSAPPKRIVL